MFDCENSLADSPESVMLEIARVLAPVLVKVKIWPALEDPNGWLLKLRLAGVTVAAGGGPGMGCRARTEADQPSDTLIPAVAFVACAFVDTKSADSIQFE